MFVKKITARSENGEMLENDDPLEPFAMLLRSQALQNEFEMVPKQLEGSKVTSEEP